MNDQHPSNQADPDPADKGEEQAGRSRAEPIDLEPVQPAESAEREGPASKLRSDESGRCPDCGASLSPGEEVCIRCGFDRSSTQSDAQASASAQRARSAEPVTHAGPSEEPAVPLAVLGRGDLWLPMGLGAAALLLLVIAHLAGAAGLFPQLRVEDASPTVPVGARLTELLRTLVLLAFWCGCGLAGLFALGVMFERPLGDARLAGARMAAIVATIRLATLITMPGPRWIEWMTEALLQAGGFIVLTALFFALAARDAAILAAWTLLAILTLWLFSFAVQWAMTAGSLA